MPRLQKLTFAQCLETLMCNVSYITSGQIVGGNMYLYTFGVDRETTSIVDMVIIRDPKGESLRYGAPHWGSETDTVEFRVYNHTPGTQGLFNDWTPSPEILKYLSRTAAKNGYLKLVSPQLRMNALQML